MLILGSQLETWDSEDACALSAQRLAGQAPLRDALIELQGDLGAGKTTFARHLLRALGVTGTIKSPTYAILEPYGLPSDSSHACSQDSVFTISHFDFYRFNDPQEWEDAGFRDIFCAPGLKLVEWADNARELLPTPDLRLMLQAGPQTPQRLACWEAFSDRGMALLTGLSS